MDFVLRGIAHSEDRGAKRSNGKASDPHPRWAAMRAEGLEEMLVAKPTLSSSSPDRPERVSQSSRREVVVASVRGPPIAGHGLSCSSERVFLVRPRADLSRSNLKIQSDSWSCRRKGSESHRGPSIVAVDSMTERSGEPRPSEWATSGVSFHSKPVEFLSLPLLCPGGLSGSLFSSRGERFEHPTSWSRTSDAN